jgi:hypothetical protein
MNNQVQTLISDLLLLARHASIVHHIPGRIRLRLSPSVVNVLDKVSVDQLMNRIPGIIKTRVNMIVGSVVIEYDHHRLSPDLWESIKRYDGDPDEASEIEGRLAALLKS